jgi:hypothetical protein
MADTLRDIPDSDHPQGGSEEFRLPPPPPPPHDRFDDLIPPAEPSPSKSSRRAFLAGIGAAAAVGTIGLLAKNVLSGKGDSGAGSQPRTQPIAPSVPTTVPYDGAVPLEPVDTSSEVMPQVSNDPQELTNQAYTNMARALNTNNQVFIEGLFFDPGSTLAQALTTNMAEAAEYRDLVPWYGYDYQVTVQESEGFEPGSNTRRVVAQITETEHLNQYESNTRTYQREIIFAPREVSGEAGPATLWLVLDNIERS